MSLNKAFRITQGMGQNMEPETCVHLWPLPRFCFILFFFLETRSHQATWADLEFATQLTLALDSWSPSTPASPVLSQAPGADCYFKSKLFHLGFSICYKWF